MPNPQHRRTSHGYISPAPGNLSPPDAKLLAEVYAKCRQQHPGEVKANKQLCAKTAWSVVNRYGKG